MKLIANGSSSKYDQSQCTRGNIGNAIVIIGDCIIVICQQVVGVQIKGPAIPEAAAPEPAAPEPAAQEPAAVPDATSKVRQTQVCNHQL